MCVHIIKQYYKSVKHVDDLNDNRMNSLNSKCNTIVLAIQNDMANGI